MSNCGYVFLLFSSHILVCAFYLLLCFHLVFFVMYLIMSYLFLFRTLVLSVLIVCRFYFFIFIRISYLIISYLICEMSSSCHVLNYYLVFIFTVIIVFYFIVFLFFVIIFILFFFYLRPPTHCLGPFCKTLAQSSWPIFSSLLLIHQLGPDWQQHIEPNRTAPIQPRKHRQHQAISNHARAQSTAQVGCSYCKHALHA